MSFLKSLQHQRTLIKWVRRSFPKKGYKHFLGVNLQRLADA